MYVNVEGILFYLGPLNTTNSVNYTPEGKWAAYDDGQPVSVILTLRMEELEPIYASDYIGGNDAQGRLDYNPIQLNEIGY